MIRPKIWKRIEFKEGKGFSMKELKSAGLSLSEARGLEIAVDLKRRSKYDENIAALVEVKSKAPPKPRRKAAVKMEEPAVKKPVEKKKAPKEKKAPSKKEAAVPEKKEAKKKPAPKKPAVKKTQPKEAKKKAAKPKKKKA